jgi:two-component system sensor histidine kinase KdpD
MSSDQMQYIGGLANQAAVAIERARLAEDIKQAQVITETERLRASLLSSISNDLNAPLGAIRDAMFSLRKHWTQFDDITKRTLLGTIEDEAERMDFFTRNLLDIMQIASDGLHLLKEPVDVKFLIEHSIKNQAKIIGTRAVTIDIPANIAAINGDIEALTHVLVNIIHNACQYSPASQPLEITATHEGAFVQITVTDHGHGIPEAERERVFDMFHRVNVSPNATHRGLGLGLSICRAIVQKHGGHIQAQPGPDDGTQIVMQLPATNKEV